MTKFYKTLSRGCCLIPHKRTTQLFYCVCSIAATANIKQVLSLVCNLTVDCQVFSMKICLNVLFMLG